MSGSLKATVLASLTSEINELRVKDEMSSRDDEFEEKFNPDIPPTQNPSIVDNIEIKREEVDYHYSNGNSDCGSDDKVNAEGMKQILHDILHNRDRSCATCIKFLKMLSAHVRATHAQPPPFMFIQDPELIDPLHIDPDVHNADQSSSIVIGIKSEPVEIVEKIEFAEEESETKGQLSRPESESANDPDWTPPASHHLTQSVPSQGLNKNKGSSDSKSKKTEKINLSSEKRFKCDVCDKRFRANCHLKIHKRIHTGEKPYKCLACEKLFTRSGDLSVHERIHTGEKRFQCQVCEKGFLTSTNLNSHMRSHTGEKPYKCTFCEKSFSQSSSLNVHKRIHSEEKRYKNRVCEQSFTTSRQIK